MHEHSSFNLKKTKKLKKALDEKEATIAEWFQEIERLRREKDEAQAKMQSANDLLL